MINTIKELDNNVLNKVSNLSRPWLDKLLVIITLCGNNGMIWFAISAPFLINKDYRLCGIKIILSVLLSGFLGEIIIKHLVGRMRPSKEIHQDDLLIKKPKSYSFPSGHTSSSISACSVLLFTYGPVALPALFLALLIAFSRIYLKVHYLSDVLAGALLGFICGFTVQFLILS